MAYYTKHLLKDGYGQNIPQMFDQANDVFEPLKKMEYFGLSTDTKPNAADVPKGATYFEIDTTNAYMCDGTTWRLI